MTESDSTYNSPELTWINLLTRKTDLRLIPFLEFVQATMNNLTFEYKHDCRLQAYLFRLGNGHRRLSTVVQKIRGEQMFWIGLLIYVIYVAALFDQTLLLLLAAAGLLWRVVDSLALGSLAPRVASATRATFRSRPVKNLRLVVTESGLHDYDCEVESFAPWSAITSFYLQRQVLWIELANGLSAAIPRATLSSGSSSLEQLIQLLKAKGVPEHEPRKPPPPKRS